MSATSATSGSQTSNAGQNRAAFVTTHWSVVLAAGATDTVVSREALASLCQNYWYPLYAYARNRGCRREDAEDLTQGFFTRLLEKNWIDAADREKGRFRSFLLVAFQRFMANEWDKARAQKRGGGVAPLPFLFETAETRLSLEPADPVTPEQSFERRWAVTLLDQVVRRLQTEYAREGSAALFAELSPCLIGDRTTLPYVELGKKLALSESAVKSAVHRLRQRYRQILREEIAQTVDRAEHVEDELRYLFSVLGKKG